MAKKRKCPDPQFTLNHKRHPSMVLMIRMPSNSRVTLKAQ
jgi:hypothetical protein